MTRHFEFLRIVPWEPKFRWVDTIQEAADLINQPHEDYPTRLESTIEALEYLNSSLDCPIDSWGNNPSHISIGLLIDVHRIIFGDTAHAGQFRVVNVRVGLHIPPKFEYVSKYMDELSRKHVILTLDDLKDFYWDFCTIHPHQDGNGRTSGVTLAVISSILCPKQGYLAPLQ